MSRTKVISYNIARFIPKPYNNVMLESALDKILSVTDVRKVHMSADPHAAVVIYRNTGETEAKICARIDKVMGEVR